MKKHKMLISLASLVVAVASTATVAAYTLAGDGSSPPAGESGGTQEPAFQDDKLPTFDPRLDTIYDGKGGVSVTNPDVKVDDPPAGKVLPDKGYEGTTSEPQLTCGWDSGFSLGLPPGWQVTAEVVGEDIFSVDGRVLEVNGERVLVMDYGDAAALEAEASGISPTGSSVATHGKASMILWAAPPHFFRTETAIVLYVGENPQVIEALTSVLGPQFAGR